MGAGYHGGFGHTSGSDKIFKIGFTKSGAKLYTRDELIKSLDGVTTTSSMIADLLRSKKVGLNVIGDRLFSYAFNLGPDTSAFYSNGQIYIRSSSLSIIDDLVHEGKHAYDDKILNKDINFIKSRHGELRAYSAEREFQLAKGRKPTYKDLNEMYKHIKKNYK